MLWLWHLINVCLWTSMLLVFSPLSPSPPHSVYRRFINEPFIKFTIIIIIWETISWMQLSAKSSISYFTVVPTKESRDINPEPTPFWSDSSGDSELSDHRFGEIRYWIAESWFRFSLAYSRSVKIGNSPMFFEPPPNPPKHTQEDHDKQPLSTT